VGMESGRSRLRGTVLHSIVGKESPWVGIIAAAHLADEDYPRLKPCVSVAEAATDLRTCTRSHESVSVRTNNVYSTCIYAHAIRCKPCNSIVQEHHHRHSLSA
jgi:hypothetical protein